jgi:hypothetical protein
VANQVRGVSRTKADAAWQARVLGASWAQAAQVAGYGTASAAYHAVLRQRGTLPEPMLSDLREVWRERLESLWSQAWQDVRERRSGAVTHAVRVAGAAMQLDGLAAPSRIAISSAESEITSLIDALLAPQVVPGQVLDDEPEER